MLVRFGRKLDQSFAREQEQGLPDRRARDLEAGSEVALVEGGAWGNPQPENLFAQDVIHLQRAAAPALPGSCLDLRCHAPRIRLPIRLLCRIALCLHNGRLRVSQDAEGRHRNDAIRNLGARGRSPRPCRCAGHARNGAIEENRLSSRPRRRTASTRPRSKGSRKGPSSLATRPRSSTASSTPATSTARSRMCSPAAGSRA